jgi:hypothetical protein
MATATTRQAIPVVGESRHSTNRSLAQHEVIRAAKKWRDDPDTTRKQVKLAEAVDHLADVEYAAKLATVDVRYGSDGQCTVSLTDDGAQGFDYTATRCGVLFAKGWIRTRSQRTAELAAKRALAESYAASLLEQEVA